MNNCIATTTDEEYLPYFVVFYNSFYEHTTDTDLVVTAVNISDKKSFSDRFNRCRVNFVDKQLSTEKKSDGKSVAGKLVSEKDAYCNNAKFFTYGEIFKWYTNSIYIDSDSIINGDLKHVFDFFESSDCILIPHPQKPGLWMGGFLGFKQCDICLEVINEIGTTLINTGKLFKWGNQPVISGSVIKFKDRLKIKEVPASLYTDFEEFSDKSYVWSGKGALKGYAQYKVYANEQEIIKSLGYKKSDRYIDKMVEYGFDRRQAEL